MQIPTESQRRFRCSLKDCECDETSRLELVEIGAKHCRSVLESVHCGRPVAFRRFLLQAEVTAQHEANVDAAARERAGT